MKILTPVALFLAVAAHSQDAAVDSSRFSIELGLRLGNYLGDITDQDGKFYRDIGLGIVDDDGEHVALDPVGTSLGFEIGGFFHLNPDAAVGAAFKIQSVTEKSSKPIESNEGTELLSARIVEAKFRLEPVEFDQVKFGVEFGVGGAFGTMRRFGLAVDNMSTIRSGILNSNSTPPNGMTLAEIADNVEEYTRTGNRPLNVSGMHFDMALRATGYIANGFGIGLRLGFERTNWSLSDTDPLQTYGADQYPEKFSGFGADFVVGIIKKF